MILYFITFFYFCTMRCGILISIYSLLFSFPPEEGKLYFSLFTFIDYMKMLNACARPNDNSNLFRRCLCSCIEQATCGKNSRETYFNFKNHSKTKMISGLPARLHHFYPNVDHKLIQPLNEPLRQSSKSYL